MIGQRQKLDCLLISPPVFYEMEENIWQQINSNFPPLGLAFIAGYLREKGKSVNIIDCNIVAPAVDGFSAYFQDNFFGRYEEISVIGITAMTCTIKKAYKIAEICRKFYPRAKIIFGGVHPTFCFEEALNYKQIDAVVIGEGELTMLEIVSGKDFNEIDGVAFRQTENGQAKIIVNKPRRRIINLDSLPMPAYDLLPVLQYRPAKGSYKKLPAMSMITSRGCPGRCTFCSKTLGNQLVFKSAEKIFSEIKYLMDNYGIRQILFYDDTFTVFKDNVLRLCDLLIDNKVKICWTCFARVDFISLELLRKMKQAGCHQIMYGVENIDEQVLKNLNKKINLGQIKRAVEWTKETGIECRLAFMVGNPGDNRAIIEKNIKFAIELDPDLIIVNITTPFPGTEMFKWAKENNLILTYNWDDYNLAQSVMRLPELSVGEIKNLYKLMYKKFYFRPGFFWKKLTGLRSLDDFKTVFDGFKSLVNFFLPKKII